MVASDTFEGSGSGYRHRHMHSVRRLGQEVVMRRVQRNRPEEPDRPRRQVEITRCNGGGQARCDMCLGTGSSIALAWERLRTHERWAPMPRGGMASDTPGRAHAEVGSAQSPAIPGLRQGIVSLRSRHLRGPDHRTVTHSLAIRAPFRPRMRARAPPSRPD
jgi:hypothetical protein